MMMQRSPQQHCRCVLEAEAADKKFNVPFCRPDQLGKFQHLIECSIKDSIERSMEHSIPSNIRTNVPSQVSALQAELRALYAEQLANAKELDAEVATAIQLAQRVANGDSQAARDVVASATIASKECEEDTEKRLDVHAVCAMYVQCMCGVCAVCVQCMQFMCDAGAGVREEHRETA